MDSIAIIYMMFFIMIIFVLIALGVFSIGFWIGFRVENKKIIKRRQEQCNNQYEESEKEIKAKKEWKKFLEYDGSTPNGVET